MAERLWLWIPKWEDFQHYTPERDRPPAWIKTYTRQLDDDRFVDLSLALRGLLESLRLALGRAGGKLPADTRSLSRRVGAQVRREHVQALCDAGLVEIVSRPALEQRLEKFYASRARARGREKEREKEDVEEEQEVLDLERMRASERELQDAHRSPADEHAEEGEPELARDDEPELEHDFPSEHVLRSMGPLRPRGAAA